MQSMQTRQSVQTTNSLSEEEARASNLQHAVFVNNHKYRILHWNHVSENPKFGVLYIGSTDSFQQAIFEFLLRSFGKLARLTSTWRLIAVQVSNASPGGLLWKGFKCMRCASK